MGIYDSIFTDDLTTLTDPDFFGESAIYVATPLSSGVPIQLYAKRQPLTANGEDRVATKTLEVWVSADPNVGIPMKPAQNVGRIIIAWGIGDTPKPYLIVELPEQDKGGWLLKLKGN